MKHLGTTVLAAVLMGTSPALASVVIFSNFSADPNSQGYPYTPNASGYLIDWEQQITFFDSDGTTSKGPDGNSVAMSFTVNTGYDIPVQSVSLAMYRWPDGTPWDGNHDPFPVNHNNLTIQLVGGTATLPDPTDLIATLAVNPSIEEGSNSILTLDVPGHPTLQAGKTYWVTARPTAWTLADTSDDSMYVWIYNNTDKAHWKYIAAPFVDNPYGAYWAGFYNAGGKLPAPTLEVLGGEPCAGARHAGVALLGHTRPGPDPPPWARAFRMNGGSIIAHRL